MSAADYVQWRKALTPEAKTTLHSWGNGRWGWKIDRQEYVKVTGHSTNSTEKYKRIVACLDPKSPFAGNIYRNDDKDIIYIKLVGNTLFRPIYFVAKTLSHLLLIETAMIIFKKPDKYAVQTDKTTRVFRSLADIIRTPIFGVTMTIVSLAGVILSPFYPPLVYEIRATIAALARELNWGEEVKHLKHDFSLCFQPLGNIADGGKSASYL